jgi:hypothetical protein
MNRAVPLPLAPPPYPAEALHSWLRRVAAPYQMTPRQLLHAVRVSPYVGNVYFCPRIAVQSALEPPDLRYLARLARFDPSDAQALTEDGAWFEKSDADRITDKRIVKCAYDVKACLCGGRGPGIVALRERLVVEKYSVGAIVSGVPAMHLAFDRSL